MASDMDALHVPVLFQETIEWLRPVPGSVFLDGTAGAGGHAEAIAERIGPDGLLVICDGDPAMLEVAKARLARFPFVRAVHADFSDADALREAADGRLFDGILLDLGISSVHLDDPERGFSFRADGPLDMRRDPESGIDSAADLLAELSEEEIARIIYEYGEDRLSRRIARAIVRRRESDEGPVTRTMELADLVGRSIPRRLWPRTIHPATRTFQGLRIAVNGELDSLGTFLTECPGLLAPGGRVAVISFHSLEDRMVKTAFRCQTGPFRALTKKPVVPGEAECDVNPRARSAKFRIAELKEKEADSWVE